MSLPFLAITMVGFFFLLFMLTVSFHYRKDRFKSIVLPPLGTNFCFYHTWLYIRLVNLSGDVEKNPGPKSYAAQYLTICHGKLNSISIAAHNFIKVALLQAYLSDHNILYACLKHTLTLLFQLMMIICWLQLR